MEHSTFTSTSNTKVDLERTQSEYRPDAAPEPEVFTSNSVNSKLLIEPVAELDALFAPPQLQQQNAVFTDSPNRSVVRPIFMEVCAGSAILSFFMSTLSKEGVQVLPIDNEANRHSQKVPILKLDLRQKPQVQLLIQLIRAGSVAGAHFAPPCGTCSRAREIPLKGGGGPKPLRTETEPFGIAG